MKTLSEVKTRLLKNKATREAYLGLEDEFSVAHEVITVREKNCLRDSEPAPKKTRVKPWIERD